MKAEEFIKQRMKAICLQIEGVSMRYAFEKSSGWHIIEVTPETMRNVNEKYAELEWSFWKDFRVNFPNENFLITEPHITHDMSNLIASESSRKNRIAPSFNAVS